MPGKDTQTTDQTQTQNQEQFLTTANLQNNRNSQTQGQFAETNPWSASAPLLKDLISKYSGLNPEVTGAQKTALDNLAATAFGAPDFSGAATGAANKFFNASTDPQIGLLSSAFGQLQGNLGGTASGAELDPYKTPGFSDAISRMTGDITDKVKGVYSAAGRAPSGAGSFAGSLGRGLTEGIAPVLAQQFNQNKQNQMGAASTLFGGAGTTAQNITGQQGAGLGFNAQGIGLLPQIYQAMQTPAQMQLNAANAGYGQQFQNLSPLLQAAMQFGGAGSSSVGGATGESEGFASSYGNTAGRSSGTSTGKSTTSQPQSTLGNILGGASSVIGLLSMLSDERAKDEVAPIGKLNDGQQVYRFRYKGDPVMRIGLLAQEVERHAPDAVENIGGLLAVDHRRATDRAANMRRAA